MSDASMFDKVMTVLGGLGAGGLLTYLGTRYKANKDAEPGMALAHVEDRKATFQEVQVILDAHTKELIRLGVELEETQKALKTSRTFLRFALAHIGLLRRDMRAAGIEPPPLPPELSSDNIPFDINMYD
ncbi:MAG: hypothetical protein LC723_14455 [Actinobacteria bacterium]|nr:hypothetical protein [Actinomycetota bacterium]